MHFRGSYLEVDLDDARPENRLLDAIGRGGGVATSFTKREIPDTLFSGFANVNSPFRNGKWNPEPHQNDVAKYGH